MLYLSEILIQHHELETFDGLLNIVREKAGSEMFFKMDVKPSFPDTPPNWEDQLEGAFVGVNSVTR
ncbi:MAG: sulfur relay protein DsrC [Gammaproteobacteria bacterium]|nr:sulfur relay protein DsrC [Gammaproteobacteria bacterium]